MTQRGEATGTAEASPREVAVGAPMGHRARMSTAARTSEAPGATTAGRTPAGGATWTVAHLPVLVPTLLTAALTAWRYDAKPLWRDEIYTLTTAGRPLGEMAGLLVDRDAGLSVYYLLVHGWLLVSHDTAWLRLPSALAAVAAVALAAALGRRVGGDAVALLAGTTVALSQALVTHAQEARPYPLVLATVTVVALLALRQAEDPRRGRGAVLGGAGVLAVGLHPLVALPAVAAVLGALWLRPGRARRRDVTVIALPAAVLGASLVLVGSLQAAADPPARMPLWKLSTFWRLVADVPAPGVVLGLLAVAGALRLARRRETLVLVAWAVLPVAAVSVLGLLGGYFNYRYATAAVPALAVLAAAGAVAVTGAALARAGWGQRGRARAIAVAALALVLVAALGPGAIADRRAAYYFDDGPGAAAQLADQALPGDAVVFVGSVSRPLVERHLPAGELGPGRLEDALLDAGDDHADTRGGDDVPAAQRRRALAGHPRVWVVGTMAVATDDLYRPSPTARAAAAGRAMVSRTDHGHVRVELWAAPGR